MDEVTDSSGGDKENMPSGTTEQAHVQESTKDLQDKDGDEKATSEDTGIEAKAGGSHVETPAVQADKSKDMTDKEKAEKESSEGANNEVTTTGNSSDEGAKKTSESPPQTKAGEQQDSTQEGETKTDAPANQESKKESRGSNKGASHPETSEMTNSSSQGDEERTESERPVTEQSIKKDKKKDRHKDKKRKKSKRDGAAGVPSLRKRSSRVDGRSRMSQASARSGVKHLEIVILSVFQPLDPQGTGFVEQSKFWEQLQSSLGLNPTEISQLQGVLLPNQSGQIPYAEFAGSATEVIASLYTNQPAAEDHWVELRTLNGDMIINYNKQTGEVMDKAESGIDLFAEVINDLYRRTDVEGKGYVTWDMFIQLLQSAEMTPFLNEQDYTDMQSFYANIPNGKASYNEFYSLAKELILRVYRAKDPSESPWCKISSQEVGEIWINKFTGETRQGIQTGDGREDEIAFINQAYAHVEEMNMELERYKGQGQFLENQLARATEEQEALEAQLYETGHALDEANAEIISRENEIDQMKAVIVNKDHQMDLLQGKLAEMDNLKIRLSETEQELQKARDTIANRDSSIAERDTNMMNLQRQAEAVTDELKTTQGEMDAQDSELSKLKHQLQSEQKRLKDYEKNFPELENKLASTKEQLDATKKILDERNAALSQTRKHLKNSRERNMDLEKEMEKLEQTQEKFRSSESEVRTLKTFLTTKTALIEKHKQELRNARLRVAELEEKDGRRAVILADVLEKTARHYQQQLGQPQVGSAGMSLRGKGHQLDLRAALEEPRPYSAPVIQPEGDQWVEETDFSAPHHMAKSFTTSLNGPLLAHSKPTASLDEHIKPRNRSRTVPKLPPIKAKQQRAKDFVFPTSNDMKREYKLRDMTVIDHTPSNPQCACELCRMNAIVVGPASRKLETGLTGMTSKTTGLPGYQGETDVRELALAKQLRIGQRVVIRIKKSEFDLEPAKLTGIVKYVGKVDSEYVDHRIYVGVKLDEAVGDTDGLVKSKRYFTCPPKHGKLVRISSVVAVLPDKSVFYRSLQDISKRSPYTTVQKKSTRIKIS